MCESRQYTYVYPDGQQKAGSIRPSKLCSSSRHGMPCSNNVIHHKTRQASYNPSSSPSMAYLAPSYFPPSPSYSPRTRSPNHRSGDESDLSGAGANTSRRRSRRASLSPGDVYLNISDQRQRSPQSGSRTIYVQGSPAPRTPPQSFPSPPTAPASPAGSPYVLSSSPLRSAQTMDARPRVDVELNPSGLKRSGSSSKKHSRNTSSPSYYSQEEEPTAAALRRRAEKKAEKEQRRQEDRDVAYREQVARKNAEINARPPVPMPPPRRSSTAYHSMLDGEDVDLMEAVRGLEIKKEKHKREQQKVDDEARDRRLRERFDLSRRNTVSGGSGGAHRSSRMLYRDDGYYYDDGKYYGYYH